VALVDEGLIGAPADRGPTPTRGAGDEPRDEVELLVVLVEPALLDSGYLRDAELLDTLLNHATGKAVVAPVIAEDCDWADTLLGKVEVLPDGGRPPATWPDPAAAWADVDRGLRERIRDLQEGASARSAAAQLQVGTMGSYSVEVDLVRHVLREMQADSVLGPGQEGGWAVPAAPASLGPDPTGETDALVEGPTDPGAGTTDPEVASVPDDMLGLLEFVSGPHRGTVEPLDLAHVSLGRHPGNHIALDDPAASSNHALLLCDESGGWTLVDLESTNGTLLNGHPVQEARLEPGDRILIGANLLRLWFPGGD